MYYDRYTRLPFTAVLVYPGRLYVEELDGVHRHHRPTAARGLSRPGGLRVWSLRNPVWCGGLERFFVAWLGVWQGADPRCR